MINYSNNRTMDMGKKSQATTPPFKKNNKIHQCARN